jgi:branched-chain amino acid transport system permease protein
VRGERYAFLILIALLLALPVVVKQQFIIHLLCNFFIFAILTTGLQLLIGCSGILSLGHAAFFGIGAYTAAILSTRLDAPFLLALLAGCGAAAVCAAIVSPILRLRDVYFAIASFAVGIIAVQVFVDWKSLTGGHDGLIMIPYATAIGITFDTPGKFYYLSLVFLIAQCGLFVAIVRGPLGRALSAMRQNENGALSVGLNLAALKTTVLIISATSAGLAGGLFAHFYGSITPQTFGWQQSITLLTMVVVGGGTNIFGVVIATFLLLILPEYFRAMAEYSVLLNGVVLVVILLALPNGMTGLWEGISHLLRRDKLVPPRPGSSFK